MRLGIEFAGKDEPFDKPTFYRRMLVIFKTKFRAPAVAIFRLMHRPHKTRGWHGGHGKAAIPYAVCWAVFCYRLDACVPPDRDFAFVLKAQVGEPPGPVGRKPQK